MRLNRFLALCGLGSRRACESLIREGRVAIDGIPVITLATIVDQQNQIITVDGKPVSTAKQFVYLLLHKPCGYITTVHDERGRKTIMELLPRVHRLFPVGRLDKETTGALLLTNDGELAYRLMHPKFNINKIYHVTLDRAISPAHVRQLSSGIKLGATLTCPCKIRIIRPDRKQLEITLHEGQKRQIRRMLKFLGYEVVFLVRIQFASLNLDGLKAGEWRYLSPQEVAQLKAMVNSG